MTKIKFADFDMHGTWAVLQEVVGIITVVLDSQPTDDEVKNCAIYAKIYTNGNEIYGPVKISDLRPKIQQYQSKIYMKFNKEGVYNVKAFVYLAYKNQSLVKCPSAGEGVFTGESKVTISGYMGKAPFGEKIKEYAEIGGAVLLGIAGLYYLTRRRRK